MKLHPVQAGDARFREWLSRYREEVTGEAPTEAWLDKYLKALFSSVNKRRHVCWAVDGGRKVGFVVAVMSKHWADRSRTQAQIGEFFIYPQFRREGLGRRLSQTVIEWLKSEGADEIQSGVIAGNLRGLRFWEAMGFQIARYSLVYRPDQPREPDEDD